MNKILLIALGCLLANTVKPQNDKAGNLLPKMALIKLKISKQGDYYNILIKDITVIDNDKKNYVRMEDNANNNGLHCFILDKSKTILDSLKINDPLVTRYEYPNEDGTIGSKEVALDEKEVIVRCPYNPRMQYLHILRLTDKKQKKTLVTLKLPNPGT